MMLRFLHGKGDFALSEPESFMLASAWTNVFRYYVKINLGRKGAAWGALLMTCSMIYTPKIMGRVSRNVATTSGPAPVPPEGPIEPGEQFVVN